MFLFPADVFDVVSTSLRRKPWRGSPVLPVLTNAEKKKKRSKLEVKKNGGKGGNGKLWPGQDARLQENPVGSPPGSVEEEAPSPWQMLRSTKTQKRTSPYEKSTLTNI